MKNYKDNLRYRDTGKYTRKQLEKAYRSLSYKARRAVRDIKKEYPKAIELSEHRKDFQPLKKLGDISDKQLEREVIRTSNFLHSQFGSLESYEAYRERALGSVSQYGITETNFDEYSAFMKKRKDEGLLGIVPSDFWQMANDIGKGKQFNQRVKALQKMLDEGRIDESTAEANIRHWVNQTQESVYGEGEFSRYYISRRRKLGSGSSDF